MMIVRTAINSTNRFTDVKYFETSHTNASYTYNHGTNVSISQSSFHLKMNALYSYNELSRFFTLHASIRNFRIVPTF